MDKDMVGEGDGWGMGAGARRVFMVEPWVQGRAKVRRIGRETRGWDSTLDGPRRCDRPIVLEFNGVPQESLGSSADPANSPPTLATTTPGSVGQRAGAGSVPLGSAVIRPVHELMRCTWRVHYKRGGLASSQSTDQRE